MKREKKGILKIKIEIIELKEKGKKIEVMMKEVRRDGKEKER